MQDAGIYARLAELGHAPVHFTEQVHARMPTREEVQALHLDAGIPVICVTRIAYSESGRPLEASEMTLSGAAYVLEYDFDA